MLLSPRHLRLAALSAVAALASACSDSTAPAVQPADLSTVLAELQPSSLAGISAQLSPVPIASLSAPTPSSCNYDAATKSFICPNVAITGVTVSRNFTLYDANDNPQTAFDKTTTAAVRMQTSASGTVTTGGTTLAVDAQQDVKVSGLLTGIHTLDGTSVAHANGTIGSGTTTTPLSSTASVTFSHLVLPRESTGPHRFPASGTITALTTATYGALPTVATSVSITFDGTSKAAVTLTVNGLTTHCTVDLSSETAALCGV
jgi:hypothetical protein